MRFTRVRGDAQTNFWPQSSCVQEGKFTRKRAASDESAAPAFDSGMAIGIFPMSAGLAAEEPFVVKVGALFAAPQLD